MDRYDVDAMVQRALSRLSLLAEATTALASTLDAQEALRRACRIMVPELADWCAVVLLEDDGRPRRACVTHRDPGRLPPERLETALPPLSPSDNGPLARALAGAGPLLLTAFPAERAEGELSAAHQELFELLGAGSAIIAPLRARRQVLGALTVTRTGPGAALTEEDLALVEDLSHRIALAVDNARLHWQVQTIAERLQRSLLPTLPHPGSLRLAARYIPSRLGARVGGDWYDSFVLPRGGTALIIGDVSGHDLPAAVAMSQLRNMLRGIACDREEPPGRILRRLDSAVHTLYPGHTATCVYSYLEGGEGGPWRLHYASAGHLPPLLVTQHGDTGFLEEGQSLLLGADPAHPRPDAVAELPARSTVVLYTDGLIERRGEPLHDSMVRLRQHAAALAREPLENFCDELLAGLATPGGDDDIALLALRLPPAGAAGGRATAEAAP